MELVGVFSKRNNNEIVVPLIVLQEAAKNRWARKHRCVIVTLPENANINDVDGVDVAVRIASFEKSSQSVTTNV